MSLRTHFSRSFHPNSKCWSRAAHTVGKKKHTRCPIIIETWKRIFAIPFVRGYWADDAYINILQTVISRIGKLATVSKVNCKQDRWDTGTTARSSKWSEVNNFHPEIAAAFAVTSTTAVFRLARVHTHIIYIINTTRERLTTNKRNIKAHVAAVDCVRSTYRRGKLPILSVTRDTVIVYSLKSQWIL